MDALLTGIVAGFGVAIPLGAIGVLLVDLGMRQGLRPALSAAFGIAVADGMYAAIGAFAGSAVSALLEPAEDAIHWASAAVLALVGIYGLVQTARGRALAGAEAAAPGSSATFGRFLGLTAINPLTVGYFAALIIGMPALGDAGSRVLFVGGVLAASLVWQCTLASTGALLHHAMGPRLRIVAGVVGSTTVLALAARVAAG